jgi:hypothetical protein
MTADIGLLPQKITALSCGVAGNDLALMISTGRS